MRADLTLVKVFAHLVFVVVIVVAAVYFDGGKSEKENIAWKIS